MGILFSVMKFFKIFDVWQGQDPAGKIPETSKHLFLALEQLFVKNFNI